MNHTEHCRHQADQARQLAATTNLQNVRERSLRSAASWDQMADRAEQVQRERATRDQEAALRKSA